MPPLQRAVFILGTGRSGTTLLRVMLAGHPGLWAPPETKLSPHDTMAQRKAYVDSRYWEKGGLRRALMDLQGLSIDEAKAAVDALSDRTVPEVYAMLQEQLGDRVLVEKEPLLSGLPERLPAIESWFDDNRYIWITRHPGAVVRSFQNMPMAEAMMSGFEVDFRTIWHQTNEHLATFLHGVPAERWTRIRYEDLVTEPRATMEQVCATIGVPFDEAVLHPYEGDRMREGPKGARATGDPNMAGRKAIRPEMATAWLDGFDPHSVSPGTRAFAKTLGYDLDAMPRPPIAAVGTQLQALFDTAAELERRIDLPMDVDDVEGRRFLLRMLSASIDTFVEQADTERPRFHHAEGPTRKMFADCPDADYLRAAIRLGPGRAYRLSGRIPPGVLYTGVLLYGRGGRVARSLTDRDLQLDAEGRFELIIATEPQDGVWLQADGDENAVMVRQYHADRAAEPAVELHLELVGPPAPPAPLDASWLAGQLARSTRMLETVFERTRKGSQMARSIALNHFVEVPADALFPTPDNQYRACWYRIGPDQAMVVRGRLPEARYFGLSLCNAWMESLDYVVHPHSNRNHSQITADADGGFTAVLTHADPGHPNWLDIAGHDAGFLLARYLLPEGEIPPMTTSICYLHELAARLDAPA